MVQPDRRGIRAGAGILIALIIALIAGFQPAAAQTLALPAGWTHGDVGSPAIAGSVEVAGDTLVVQGAGSGLVGTTDQFHFVYIPVSGDVDLQVRVATLASASPGGVVGIMVREALTPTSMYALAMLSPSQASSFQSRARNGARPKKVAGPAAPTPAWIRLVRARNLFRAYVSATGGGWTLVGSATVGMGVNAYAGLAVTSGDPGQVAAAGFTNLTLGSAPSSLPSPWTSSDVGNPAVPGGAIARDGTFTVVGAGRDIWKSSDEFHFAYQRVTGDTQITARLASLEASNGGTKAGVMIREALTGSAAHASMVAVAAGSWMALGRLFAGNPTYQAPGTSGTPPGWVRLVREGNVFSSYESRDGWDWTLVDTETIPMPDTVYVGLAVTGRSASTLATAVFTDVSVTAPSSGTGPPAVAITSPAGGAAYDAPASIGITATASDADGLVSRVDFYAGTTLVGSDASAPYSATWNNVAAGTYSLTAVATDNGGLTTTSAPVSVTVNGANLPPTVAIGAPAGGATYVAPASIAIAASAADPDGTVARVDFFAGSQLLGSDTASPYSFTWTNVSAGIHALTAVATDNAGRTSTSATVTVTVTPPNAPPVVSITSPASGAAYGAPATVGIAAAASDGDGSVSRVDFYANGLLVASDVAAPFSVTWSNVAAGTYTLTAVATDNGGKASTSAGVAVSVTAPLPPVVTRVVFVPGSDYATSVTSWTVQLRRAGDSMTAAPVASSNLGKPAVVAGEVTVDISALVNALAAGSYYASIVSTGPGGSAMSAPSPSFTK